MTPDIDLIPADYREIRRRWKWIRITAVLTAAACVSLTLSGLHLSRQANAIEATNADALVQTALARQQTEQLATLDERVASMTAKWQLLQSLRHGAAAESLFTLIDQALPAGEVWFDEVRLVRAGVEPPTAATTETAGYFVVVNNTAEPTANVRTTMSIKGHATDHAALSKFVRHLYTNKDVVDVRLNRTSRQAAGARTPVSFELAITLGGSPEQPA